MDEYYQAVRAIPTWLAAPLAQLPVQTAVRIQELRLRTGCAVTHLLYRDGNALLRHCRAALQSWLQ